MKNSNKLLISLVSVIFLAIVGTNLILKAEYNKIDLNDDFYGYSLEKTNPFKVIQLQGNGYGIIQIQPGDNFQIRVKDEYKDFVKWNLKNDTLVITSLPERDPNQFDKGEHSFVFPAIVYVMAPELNFIHLDNVKSRISGWRDANLMASHEGPEGGIYLDNNTFKNIDAVVQEGGLLKIGTNNEVVQMKVKVNRYSSVEAEKDVFQSLQIKADSLSTVKLPSSLLREFVKE